MKKHNLFAFLLAFTFALSACQESNTEPVDTTTFSMTKNKIMLTRTMPMDSTIMFLTCGCYFTVSVESFSGDTSVIHYTKRDATNGAYRIAFDVMADTNVGGGNYTAKIAVMSSGKKGTYRDTLSVEYAK
jgi:hypothetical protein